MRMGRSKAKSKEKDETSSNSLRCMYTNADSLHNKLDEFKQDVKNYDPDLIAINEVKPKNSRFALCKEELSLEGYGMYTNNWEDTQSRGIMIYVRDSLESCEVEISSDYQEKIWINIKTQAKNDILVGCTVYTGAKKGLLQTHRIMRS